MSGKSHKRAGYSYLFANDYYASYYCTKGQGTPQMEATAFQKISQNNHGYGHACMRDEWSGN